MVGVLATEFSEGDILFLVETVDPALLSKIDTIKDDPDIIEGPIEHFDAIVISGEVGFEKPDRKIFEVALNSLGVKAENAVMVGNRVDADIIGANRLGMTSVWFKWNNRYPASINSCEKKPDFTIFSLLELTKVLGLS